jgi:hypothetical protein
MVRGRAARLRHHFLASLWSFPKHYPCWWVTPPRSARLRPGSDRATVRPSLVRSSVSCLWIWFGQVVVSGHGHCPFCPLYLAWWQRAYALSTQTVQNGFPSWFHSLATPAHPEGSSPCLRSLRPSKVKPRLMMRASACKDPAQRPCWKFRGRKPPA